MAITRGTPTRSKKSTQKAAKSPKKSANKKKQGAKSQECCICLYKYVEGSELCNLHCKHHFYHKCMCKWFKINATFPLCKYNILRADATLV